MNAQERLAVIDLGSNSFRLVVFAWHGERWQRVDEIYQPVRIGEGLAASGRLGERPMARALAALDVFAHFCRASALAPEQIDAVGTSAIRDAENAPAFLRRAREQSGLAVRVLSREEEARCGYLAAVNSTTLGDGCVVDLGGGSMQIVRVRERRARHCGSWPLGTVRMTESFLPGREPAQEEQMARLRAHVARELRGERWPEGGAGRMVVVGGTARNLATAAQRAAGLLVGGVQGATVERHELGEIIERLAALAPAERAAVPGIKPARADVVLAGAIVLDAVLDAGGFDRFEVTEAGLREGVFFQRLLAGREPPLFEDVRRSSVLNLAGRYGVEPRHTDHVAALALGMFDELARLGLHKGSPRERELLWAASALHDIGMSVDYDDHHKHSQYLILNAGLPGFTPRELAIVAQATRYHRKGMPEPGPLAPLLTKGDLERLDRCAVLLRLAEDLERSRDQAVRATELSMRNGTVSLHLVADGETAVPRWAASRERALFNRAFGRELAIA